MNETAGRVAAKQSALGALENLESLDIVDGKGLGLGHRQIPFIKISGVGRLDDVVEIILGYAANRELGVLAGNIAADMHPGGKAGNIEALLHPQRAHLVTAEHRYCDPDILQILFALLCGDRDFFKQVLGGSGNWHSQGSE